MIGALTFLTVVGRSRPPGASDTAWFPVVGALVGAVVGLVWWGASELWPSGLAAAVVVLADFALTGLLHVDGLADSADGLLPHLEREQRLAVMAAPDVGAFAVATVATMVLLRWSAVAALPVSGWRGVLLFSAVWTASRAAMVFVMATQPYARAAGGMASPFLAAPAAATPAGAAAAPLASASAAVALVVAAAASLVVTASADGPDGMPAALGSVAVVIGLGAGALVVALARRRVGGYTGDVLGALGIVVETVALVVLGADPAS